MRQSAEDQRKYANVYPDLIARRMEEARRAETSEERMRCLAEAVAANGLYQRAREIAYYPDKPYFPAINKIAGEIVKSKAFGELMAGGGDKSFAEAGNVSTLTARLKAKNDALNTEGRDPTVNEVIYDVQEKARTLMATPRDYAKLVAAYHLSSWKETVDLSNGKTRSELRYDYEKRLDGGELNEETERVLKDPDFQYLMKHEKKTVSRCGKQTSAPKVISLSNSSTLLKKKRSVLLFLLPFLSYRVTIQLSSCVGGENHGKREEEAR